MKRLVKALRHPRDYRWAELRPFQAHSAVLTVAGIAYVTFGLLLGWTDPPAGRREGLELGLKLMPLEAWGAVWIAAGAAAIISARWPPASKTWGYSILVAVPACWSALYAVGIPAVGVPVEYASSAVIWGCFAFMWAAIARLINPDDVDEHIHAVVLEHEPDDQEP